MHRKTYHTSLKDLVRLGICPASILAMIPRANIYRWKSEAESKYFGRENDIASFQSLLLTIEQHPGFFFACGRLIRTLTHVCEQIANFKNHLNQHKDQIIRAISSARQVMPLSQALRFFNISRNTYYNWKNECDHSPAKLCKRRYIHQLTSTELAKLESLLKASKFRHWSIPSLQLWAKRNNIIHASLNTWYKYNRYFSWRNLRERFRKFDYSPLRAVQPNAYWHADISVHKCLDGTKGYIYTVMDNASRKVLTWKVTDHLSGAVMKQVLEEAKSMVTTDEPIHLIVDGGSENFNASVDDFLRHSQVTRLRATVDLHQSNSMVESVFHQLKHRYLLKQDIHTLAQLEENVSFFFEDTNKHKPLKVLKGLTPDEYYSGMPPENVFNKEDTKVAIAKRKAHNKNNQCIHCLE